MRRWRYRHVCPSVSLPVGCRLASWKVVRNTQNHYKCFVLLCVAVHCICDIFDERDFNRHSNEKRLNFIKLWVQNLKPCVVVLLCCPLFKRDLYSRKRALCSTKTALYSIKRALHSTFQSNKSACSLHKRPVFYARGEAVLYFTKTALHYHQNALPSCKWALYFEQKSPIYFQWCVQDLASVYIYIYVYTYIYICIYVYKCMYIYT